MSLQRRAAFSGLLASLSAVVASAAPATQPTTQQSHEGFELRADVRYLQYLPPGYADDPTDATHGGDGHGWPLVMFLHGSGQRGTNLEVVKQEGLPKLVAEGRDYPFILLSPQVDLGAWWDSRDLLKLLDHAEQALHVDHDRIYITGLSMGGYGTWDLASYARGRLAAIVPICGGGNHNWPSHSDSASTLAVWAFHGADDDVVNPAQSQEMVDAFKAIGNTNAKLTIYPGVGHPAWRKAYDDPELFTWMLAQRRREPATKPTSTPTK